MKSKGWIFGLIVLTFIFSFSNCKKENQLPSCSITYPNNGDEFEPRDTINISVEANDIDGLIAEINFYIDSVEIISTSSFPYGYSWSTIDETIGDHTIKVIAKDNDGGSKTDECTISIIGVSDLDGNIYKIIQIGNQVWMGENLKVTHYPDGSPISLVEDNSVWETLDITDKAYCYYKNSSANGNIYGALYTWAAAMNGSNSSSSNPSNVQGVCPSGWHIPSDTEWNELEMYLGMSQSETDVEGWRGTNEGSKLAGNSDLWKNGVLENDADFSTSGLAVLPAGYRNINGLFYNLGEAALIWSATEENSSDTWIRNLHYENNSNVMRGHNIKDSGLSVRCIKDE